MVPAATRLGEAHSTRPDSNTPSSDPRGSPPSSPPARPTSSQVSSGPRLKSYHLPQGKAAAPARQETEKHCKGQRTTRNTEGWGVQRGKGRRGQAAPWKDGNSQVVGHLGRYRAAQRGACPHFLRDPHRALLGIVGPVFTYAPPVRQKPHLQSFSTQGWHTVNSGAMSKSSYF